MTEAQIDKETYTLVLELRNALAAALRTLSNTYTEIDDFLAKAHRAGIKDGLGERADEWLRKQEEP